MKSSSLGKFAAAVALTLAFMTGCTPEASSTNSAPKSTVTLKANVYPAPKRVVAFGDVHGDLGAAQRALKLAGAIDDAGAWIGGDLFVVQVGDQLDRGNDDRKVLDYFEMLVSDAKSKGGTFLVINGNHELMNVSLDFRFVSPDGLSAFADIAAPPGVEVNKLPAEQRGRAAAMAPGGTYAQKLAERSFYAVVGNTVFVHGGILPKHIQYGLEKLDDEMRAWLLGKTRTPPEALVADDGPVWTRLYSENVTDEACKTLGQVLDTLGMKRMVMGHTVQKKGITIGCDGKAIRTDTGMSRGYHSGPIQVVDIQGDDVKILKE
ncbi:MAG: metallophosphoesterase [Polyangiaceae bacterium]